MHALVAAIHRQGSHPNDWMNKFLEGNEDYFEREAIDADAAMDSLDSSYQNCQKILMKIGPGVHSEERMWARDFIDRYEAANNPGEKLHLYAYDNGYNYDEEKEEAYLYTNPNSECDYYLVGGRYENIIVTKDGTKTTSCPLSEYSRMDLVGNMPYAYTTEDNREWEVLEEDIDQWETILDTFRNDEENWWITAVDCHY